MVQDTTNQPVDDNPFKPPEDAVWNENEVTVNGEVPSDGEPTIADLAEGVRLTEKLAEMEERRLVDVGALLEKVTDDDDDML
jgi:hypothetical protein